MQQQIDDQEAIKLFITQQIIQLSGVHNLA